ncbi:MAG TPA: methylmalonyl-CoA mutase, partial [Flavobacterium sp.]|nr:methylmalonyl-CoA mutase [Flavobacterium sp.]
MKDENKLFNDFKFVSSKMWKQKIQFELNGADYNENLIWESNDGIKVKPFYHFDQNIQNLPVTTEATKFKILQQIYVYNVEKSNAKALNTIQRGADSIKFTIENKTISIENLLQNLPLDKVVCFFNLAFLSIDFIKKLKAYQLKYKSNFIIQLDPIYHLLKTGNYHA